VRSLVGDDGQVVRRAGGALRLDEDVAAPRLRGDAPARLRLAAVAAETGGDVGDGFAGVEDDVGDDAALDRDGDDRLRVVPDLPQPGSGGSAEAAAGRGRRTAMRRRT
jgi:hypothetical protein